MLIHSASQIITLSGGPQRGADFGRLGIIENGAVLIEGEAIKEVGPTKELLQKHPNAEMVDANGMAVIPGLIDPHTHLVWAGDRAGEFEMRLEGRTYMEIMAAGGGIQSTVNATRAASDEDLIAQSRKRAMDAFRSGTTTMEAKSGYGLEVNTEIRQLRAALALHQEGPLEIAPTFLGAHAIPAEYKESPDAYVRVVCDEMLPAVKDWWGTNSAGQPLPFVDVFCEPGAFSLAQTQEILTSAKALGFPLKVHADEFENIGGAALAAELGAVSADHLVKTALSDMEAMAAAGTIAVSLPCTPFGLAEPEYSPADEIISSGCVFALASDLNPGTAWSGNMQFVMALACRYMGLTPAQALAAATINAAAAIGRDNRVGSIEAGKQADVLILNTADYRQMAYRFGTNLVDSVIKKGKFYDREALCSL